MPAENFGFPQQDAPAGAYCAPCTPLIVTTFLRLGLEEAFNSRHARATDAGGRCFVPAEFNNAAAPEADPFATEAPAFTESAPAFSEAPPAAQQDTFSYEPSPVAEPAPPPVPTGPSPYKCALRGPRCALPMLLVGE